MTLHSDDTIWPGGEADRQKFRYISETTKIYGDYLRKEPSGAIQDDDVMDLYLRKLAQLKIQSFVKSYGSKETIVGELGWQYSFLLGRSSVSSTDRRSNLSSVKVARDLYLQVILNPTDAPDISMIGMFFVPAKASRMEKTYVAGAVL